VCVCVVCVCVCGVCVCVCGVCVCVLVSVCVWFVLCVCVCVWCVWVCVCLCVPARRFCVCDGVINSPTAHDFTKPLWPLFDLFIASYFTNNRDY